MTMMVSMVMVHGDGGYDLVMLMVSMVLVHGDGQLG